MNQLDEFDTWIVDNIDNDFLEPSNYLIKENEIMQASSKQNLINILNEKLFFSFIGGSVLEIKGIPFLDNVITYDSNLINTFVSCAYIPPKTYLIINGIIFYKALNSSQVLSLFSFPDGYKDLNKNKIYPFLTCSIQLCVCQNFTNHNSHYNGLIQIQIKFKNDKLGDPIDQTITVSGNYEAYIEDSIVAVIYLLETIYNFLRKKNIASDFYFPELSAQNYLISLNKKKKSTLDNNLKHCFSKLQKFEDEYNKTNDI